MHYDLQLCGGSVQTVIGPNWEVSTPVLCFVLFTRDFFLFFSDVLPVAAVSDSLCFLACLYAASAMALVSICFPRVLFLFFAVVLREWKNGVIEGKREQL